MNWESLLNNSFLIKLLVAVVEVLVGFVLGPLAKRLLLRLSNRKGVDEGVLTFTGSFLSLFVRVLAVVIALGQLGADMTAVIGIFSAMGLGISLALKESMANVAGGLQILLTKPFGVGDYISCQDQEGTVQEIELMFTTLQTFNNQLIVVPNSILVSNSLINYTKYPTRRLVLPIPVAVMKDADAFCAAMQKEMENNPKILKSPAPRMVVGDYTADGKGVEINAICYTLNDNYWEEKYAQSAKMQELRKTFNLEPPISVVSLNPDGQV